MQLDERVSGSRGSTLWWSHPRLHGCDTRTNAPGPVAVTVRQEGGSSGASVCVSVVGVCVQNKRSHLANRYRLVVAVVLHPLVAVVQRAVHMLCSAGIDKQGHV